MSTWSTNPIKSKPPMKKRYYILLSILAILLVGGSIGLYMYFKPQKDFGKSTPDFVLSDKDLLNEFEASEANATQKFVTGDKTILVSGTISEVSRNADGTFHVVLTEADMSGSIQCSLMAGETEKAGKLKKGEPLQIKGQCAGLQELIDKQVTMIRCVIAE
jgi:hypothetical protein